MPTYYSPAVLPSAILGQEDVVGDRSQRGKRIKVLLAFGKLLCEIRPVVIDGDRVFHANEVD